jgi:ATP-dependent Clp protease ATP-binding subunit ClpC
MSANLLLHVREHPEGRVIVTPVDFPDLSVDADNYEAALRVVRGSLSRKLRNMTGSMRTALAAPVVAELDRVELALKRDKGTLRITIGLVVTMRETSGGLLYVVRAPEIDDFAVSAPLRDAVRTAARQELKYLRNWSLDALLASDEVGDVRLETLMLPFPPADEASLSRADDQFSLEEFGDELTARAAEGRLGQFDRRDTLVERVLAALASPGRSSVMLVGPSAVGKTALLHEVAARLAGRNVPPALRGRPLWRISANELIAGATYSGMWQDRARLIVSRARQDGTIFAMGDPTGIIDAGRWSKSDNNVSRYLRPYVESGEVSLICECTPEVFAAAHKSEPSFMDAFHRVDVPEPNVEAAGEILVDAGRRLEAGQEVEIDDDALAAALELTQRFEPYRALPGKALRLLDEVVQRVVTRDGERRIGRDEVTSAFAERTGLPLLVLSDEVSLRLEDVRAFFEERVLGQEEAVETVVDLIALTKAGLQDPHKPLGSFFFVGPTGVGKTELTKALAEYLFGSSERVLRFDMAEYSSGDAVPKLIGTAWRSDGEGELTRRVREQPFCVVLLDEIEKAHPDVFDALLSALGEGRLTDANGRTADFRNAIVVMTSNLGATQRESSALGFGSSDTAAESERLRRHFVEQAERFFRPEFFNRIDRVLPFGALEPEVVRRIARRELGRLLMREGITRRRLLVEIDDAVVENLAERGFHPRYGARPLQREIERAVISPLARLLVEQRPDPGDLVRFTCRNAEICVAVEKVTVPAKPRRSTRPPAPPTEATLSRAGRRASELHAELESENRAAPAQSLRMELSALVEQTGTPGFWDSSAHAKATMERLYQVERVLERFDALRGRAEGLAEMALQVQRNRHRGRLAELRQAIAEIEAALEGCRLELAGTAAGGESSEVVLRITPVAGADEWAAELLGMYVAWAARTGRESSRRSGAALSVSIKGPSTFALLRREAGLHRRVFADVEPQLARVTVAANGASDTGGDDPVVVRVYAQGRRQFVRDPRTGARVGDVTAVLGNGRIDEFLLAALRL